VLAGAVAAATVAVAAALLGGPAAGVAVLAGVIGAVAFVAMPGVLFAAYLLLAFYKAAAQPFSPVDLTVILGIANALQILPLMQERRPRAISLAGLIAWSALTLLLLAGVLYAPDQDLALDSAVRWWSLAFVPILPGALRTGSDARFVRQFVWSFFAMGTVTVLLGLSELSSTQRLTVFATNTIQVARAALLVPIIGIAFVMREHRAVGAAVSIVLVPLSLIVAVGSGSRGPLAVLAVMAVVGVIRYLSRRPRLGWRAAGIIGALVLVSIATVSTLASDLPAVSIERFGLLGDFVAQELAGESGGLTSDTSAATRVTLFRLAVDLFIESPVLGAGTAGFEALGPRFLSPLEAEPYPHNAVLQFAAELGVAGLSILVVLLALAATRRLPPGNAERSVRLLVAFFFLNALISGDIFADRETWGLIMLVLMINAPGAATQRVATTDSGASPIDRRPPAVAAAGSN
jgi:O-antigen ligase